MLTVELSPRALRDLRQLPSEGARAILDDLELFKTLPWPGPPKIKPIRGTPYVRLRTGGCRSIALRQGQKVTVMRVVARKDLERVLKGLP